MKKFNLIITFIAAIQATTTFSMNLTKITLHQLIEAQENHGNRIMLPQHIEFDCAHSNVSDEELCRIFELLRNKLKVLRLTHCQIDGSCLAELPGSVVALKLNYCKELDVEQFRQLRDKTNLKIVDLSYSNITGVEPRSFPDSVQYLNLNGCKDISDGTLIGIQTMLGLKTIKLGLTPVTGFCMRYLPQGIETVEFFGCKKLDDLNFQYLRGLRSIKKLSFEETNITGLRFYCLPPNLEFLNIRGCRAIEIPAKKYLEENRITFEWLNFDMEHEIRELINRREDAKEQAALEQNAKRERRAIAEAKLQREISEYLARTNDFEEIFPRPAPIPYHEPMRHRPGATAFGQASGLFIPQRGTLGESRELRQ